MNAISERIKNEVTKVIKGKDAVVEKVLMAILARGNVLLEDVPGVGKTTMALAFAKSMGLATRRVQFTPDTMPSDIIGFSVYDKETIQRENIDINCGARSCLLCQRCYKANPNGERIEHIREMLK